MISSWLTRLAALLVCLVVLAFPQAARAQAKGAVHVVNLDSDDSTEDHADALTAALKSRVRSTAGWQMAETNDSLAMLIPALKCPAKPDAACLVRVGDQLKTDRFFWGTMSKATTPHQVTAEVHLWIRGKPEQSVKESYSENLKDQNDEALRKIAGHFFERLTGSTTEGSVTIHSSVPNAQVLVDGQPKGTLDKGVLTLTLAAGSHNVELRADGFAPTGQTVVITTGADSSITIDLTQGASIEPPPVTPSKPLPVQKILGFSALGVGLVLGGVAAIEGVLFLGKQSDNNDDHSNPRLQNVADFCTPPQSVDQSLAQQACDRKKSAEEARTFTFVFMGLGAAFLVTGAILLATDKSASSERKPTAIRVTPSFGPGGGGLALSGAF